jgi:glycosyltransferase involved in cell wall biosynthesis
MRIGIDARFLGFNSSGMARYSESLVEALSRVDERNDYVVFVHSELKRRLRVGDNFQVVPVRGHPLRFQSMRRLAKAVHREALDLLHALFPLTPFWLDAPTLLTVHDVLPFQVESGLFYWRVPLARLLYAYFIYPHSLGCAKWVICVSRATRDAVAEMFPDVYNKSIVVHSGVDEIFRQPLEAATLDLIRRRLSLPERYILYSGAVRADKNVLGVLRVFALLRKRNPRMEDIRLIIETSSEASALDALKKPIRQLGLESSVRVLRNVNDEERRAIFADAGALLILSRHEGFGMPVVEAQLSGLPVIAADSGALPEIAGERGAVLVNPDNEEECVSLMERVLTSDGLRAYLIDNGRANAQYYNWPRAVAELVQIYELLFYSRNQVEQPTSRNLLTRVLEWLPF